LKIVTEKKKVVAYNLWSARWDAKAKLMFCVEMAGKHLNKKNNAQERATI
jgi:hypothetical protein